jgi:hypothetical protein
MGWKVVDGLFQLWLLCHSLLCDLGALPSPSGLQTSSYTRREGSMSLRSPSLLVLKF